MNKLLTMMAAVAVSLPPLGAGASSVTIDSVVQRWPWNNKVDIAYTVSGGQTRSSGVYYGLRFALTANGQTYSFEGHSIGASAENGSHTVTWTAPTGIVTTDASLTATLFTTNVPSGNDYMIVDLTSGTVTYEGLFATQDASNARYNMAPYKTDKMVLRKIPRTADSGDLPNGPFLGGYPTGTDAYNQPTGSENNATNWTTDLDYFIGVYPVTQYQYQKICDSNPSMKTGDTTGTNIKEHRPVEYVSWLDLRSPYYDNATDFSPTSSIPATLSNSGNFFQRLNFKTGLYFDLPTEVMFEIAERAGATTKFSWGDTTNAEYVVCSENSGNSTFAVGARLPNSWGLYDTAGNVAEWTLDGNVSGNLTARADAFTPAVGSGTARRLRGGARWNLPMKNDGFRASYRDMLYGASGRYNYNGFRVSLIAK